MAVGQLEVAVLDREREHRTFRRLTGARLEALLAQARPANGGTTAAEPGDEAKSDVAAKPDATAKPDAKAKPDAGPGDKAGPAGRD